MNNKISVSAHKQIKLIRPKKIVNINDHAAIELALYCQRHGAAVSEFYDVEFKINDKRILLGRFNNIDQDCSLDVKYNNGKVLVFEEKYNKSTKKFEITKVHSLYEIVDDTFYSCTEEDAIDIFDKKLNSTYLENKDNMIYRADIEKIKKYII